MARSILRDREKELGILIFGDEIEKVSIPALAKRTGISVNTLYKWRQHPYTIPTGKLLQIVKLTRMDPERRQRIFECI